MSAANNLYDVKRDLAGRVTEICPVNLNYKVGSFDCTYNCPKNKNTPKEIQHYAFDLPKVRCSEIVAISERNNPKINL